MVSPRKGQPILPGGRLSLGCFLLKRMKKMRRRGRKRDIIEQRVSDMEVGFVWCSGVFYVYMF